jgi:hypothetical protein
MIIQQNRSLSSVIRIAICILFASTLTQQALAQCGCMDVALLIDDSGSMGGAIDNVKTELPQIVASAVAASGEDVRFGLVSFPGIGLTNDGVVVRQAFTTDATIIHNAVQGLSASGGAGEPESSDTALEFVVTGSTASGCVISNAPLGTFRSGCVKIAVLVTDAHPGGCHDTFTVGVDDVHARQVASEAADAGVLVSAIYVPTAGVDTEIKNIMEDYADISGGVFVQAETDGTGTGEGISDIIASCGGLTSQCITRTARYWSTHATGSDTNCATLLKAIQLNGGIVNLGFVHLPVAFENADNVMDATDAFIEALSFYWRAKGRTGDNFSGSRVCKARKLLAPELIAAIANSRLFRTKPDNCTYFDGLTVTNFPANLIQQARLAAEGADIAQMKTMTALLRKFNSSGVINDFPAGLAECSPNPTKLLRRLARDPTTRFSCPGVNDNCASAEEIIFVNSTNLLSIAKFSTSLSIGVSTTEAWWKISPPTAASGRTFTADTFGSSFDTLLNVFSGTCSVVTSNGQTIVDTSGLVPVVSNDNANNTMQSQVSFTTDGTSTYFIEVTSAAGVGRLKLKVRSP